MVVLKLATTILAIVLLCSSVRGDPCSTKTGTTYIADPPSCTAWIYCVNGVSSGTGNCSAPYEFNSATNACDYADNVVCPVVGTSQADACLYKATGTFTANPDNCHGYFYCNQSIAEPGLCNADYYFNATSLLCHYDPDYVCPATPDTTTTLTCATQPDGTFLPNNASCSAYYVCENGAPIAGSCNTTYYFNAATGQCDYPDNVVCADAPTTSINATAICLKTNSTAPFASDPKSCANYYYCKSNSSAILATCPDSLYFDATLQSCLSPADANCTVAPCTGAPTGQFVTGDEGCASYYYCAATGAVAGNCTNGNYFDEANQICASPSSVTCAAATTTTTIAPGRRSADGVFDRFANSVLDFMGV